MSLWCQREKTPRRGLLRAFVEPPWQRKLCQLHATDSSAHRCLRKKSSATADVVCSHRMTSPTSPMNSIPPSGTSDATSPSTGSRYITSQPLSLPGFLVENCAGVTHD